MSSETIASMAEGLRKEAAEKVAEAERLQALAADFPDLTKHVNRWKRVRYTSAIANPKVTGCEITHNCGCCADSPLEVWPYLETPNGRVYSNPPVFWVGERYYDGDRPTEGWDLGMREKGIPEEIIDRVRSYLGLGHEE